ncbi:Oxidoreductase AflY [Leucoagaricus sp. SymC.cos]|nr:Oxidoreductase AflY [Leucoagaricus sp. SymC.cos]
MPADLDGNFLFPTPSSPPSTLSPYHWPGVSPESTRALKNMLIDNHKRWHIFFSDEGFHNHSAHRSIAIWSLGADPAVITAAYELDCKEQRPAFESPEPITNSNFEEHLGDARFYDAYINFFGQYTRKHGIDKTLETFMFSKECNSRNTEMLSRFLSGLLHPLIHAGYGAEFSLPGMLVEGKRTASRKPAYIHRTYPGSFPKFFFDTIYSIKGGIPSSAPGLLSSVTREVGQVAAHLEADAVSANGGADVHALTILARVAADSRLTLPKDLDELMIVQNVIADHAEIIRDYAMQWSIDLKRPGEINRKVEEISWMNATIFGIAGWTWSQQVEHCKEGGFNADFFFLHLVTSAAFIPSLLARISHSPHSQILLRSYLAVSLSWYITRARPKLDVRGFFTSSTATAYPLPINTLPTPHQDALPGQDKVETRVPDPWLPIVQTTVVHPDSHLPKAIRALASWASSFGSTPAGTFSGPQSTGVGIADTALGIGTNLPSAKRNTIVTELPGAEYLDGSLFICTAGLTIARMGRVGQGEVAGDFWDFGGFFEDPKLTEEAVRRVKARIFD